MSEFLTKLAAYSSCVANWFNYQVRLIKVGVKRSNPLFVGLGSTRLFLAFVAVLAVLPQKDEEGWSWRVFSFLTSPSNEIGDTLAGIAGALAFLWIIVTVMLQSKELKAQREVLLLTKQEMAEQREATQDMARSMKAQAAVFEDEQRQRLEARNHEHLHQIIQSLRHHLYNFGFDWHFGKGEQHKRVTTVVSVFPFSSGGEAKAATDEALIRKFALNMDAAFPRVCDGVATMELTRSPKRADWAQMHSKVELALSLEEGLSLADQEYIERAGIRRLFDIAQKYLAAEIWDGRP